MHGKQNLMPSILNQQGVGWIQCEADVVLQGMCSKKRGLACLSEGLLYGAGVPRTGHHY